MLITPYVANDAEEADSLTNAFQKKAKGKLALIGEQVKLRNIKVVNKSGFTILEVMVALAIVGISIGIFLV